jgi:ABC transporter
VAIIPAPSRERFPGGRAPAGVCVSSQNLENRPGWGKEIESGLEIIAGRAEALGRFMEAYGRLARLPLPNPRDQSLSTLVFRAAALETRCPIEVCPGQEIHLRVDGDQIEQIFGLLDSPTEGQYLLNGIQVEKLSFSDRARIRNREIGFIFQSFNLIGDLTVFENVELPLTYRRHLSAAERKNQATSALERVGMSHRQRHFPSQLSGGQQQRVAVARALAGSPAILLADEIYGNL